MSKKLELRLSGSGGQGLITAGIILAEAAILDGKNAVQTQSYGPEARGGASKAEVIICSNTIDFPKVTLPNMSLSLTQLATDKYAGEITSDGIVIVDESIKISDAVRAKAAHVYELPILHTARDVVGKEIVANIVSLGVINGLTHIVSEDHLEQVILSRIPKGTEELNLKALAAGYALVKK